MEFDNFQFTGDLDDIYPSLEYETDYLGDIRDLDLQETVRIRKFLNNDCCKSQCNSHFNFDLVSKRRNEILSLEENERDLLIIIMGALSVHRRDKDFISIMF